MIEVGDIVRTEKGDFTVAKVDNSVYPLKAGQEQPSPRVYRIENSKYESMLWGHYLLHSAVLMKMPDCPTPFHVLFYNPTDKVNVTSVEGNSLESLSITVENLEVGYELKLDVWRDSLPYPIMDAWSEGGRDVHLVSGIENILGGFFSGGIVSTDHIKTIYEAAYPEHEVKVELAYSAGHSWMPFYRVWLRPKAEVERVRELLGGKVFRATGGPIFD